MREQLEIGRHSGVCMVVGVEREVVDTDARNFGSYPYLRTFNPYMLVTSRIIDHMLEHGRVVLTANNRGGPIEVITNGVPIKVVGSAVTERSLGLAIRLFSLQRIRDTEQADKVAKKVVRDGKAVVFEMVP